MRMKFKEVIFSLTMIALFAIVGNMEQDYCTPETGMILAAIDYIVMAWSGFGSGLLQKPDGKRGRSRW